MFSSKKSPLNNISKHKPVDSDPKSSRSKYNPFDSDDELDDKKQTVKRSKRTSDPTLITPNLNSNPLDDHANVGKVNSSSASYSNVFSSSARNKYKNDFRESGGFENQSMKELESYAVYKAGETTKTVHNCLKIAEDIRENATKTLVSLHQQGEQITRTHTVAADIDHDLSRGEKLLGSLGGIFSKTWKPKKTRPITGPMITRDDSFMRRNSHLEQKERAGINPASKGRTYSRAPPPESANAMEQVEFAIAKQDDALSDLSNLLGELKNMAVDMGSEIERHNKSMGHLYNDVDEINYRLKGANQRGRRLLGK